jgi:hypothetical protein
VILSIFLSRFDLQNFRKRKFLGEDQGKSINKGTVQYNSMLTAVA